MRDYYRNFAQVLVEVVRSVSLSARGAAPPRGARGLRTGAGHARRGHAGAARGRAPVQLGVDAARRCRWSLGYPLEAAYKPLVDGWAQREMLKARSRFGARLVPAQELLAHILRGGRTPRAIAMVADQEPRTSERRHWTRFMNRDTAFFMGAEEITRVTKFPAFFVGLRRTRRGHYAVRPRRFRSRGEARLPGR